MGVYQVGEVIKKTRESLGITQEELSYGICSAETLSRIENGKRAPSRTNFRALMDKMGKSGEKYMPFLHSRNMGTIVESVDIDVLIAHDKHEEADKAMKGFKKKINLDDNVNRQYVIRTQALIDYRLGRINVQEERAQLTEALLCTVPNYKEGILPLGIYSRHEVMIFCNIAISYSLEGDQDTAIRMLRQAETYFDTTKLNMEERAISETLMLCNLGQCLGIRGEVKEAIEDTKEAIKIEEKGVKKCLDGGVSNILEHLLYNIAFEKEILQENEKACKELLLQAYFVAELNNNSYMMGHIKEHMKKVYGDAV